jgi:UDP-glucose 4-epimerase
MRYLVTGCAGFIGSSIVRALLDRGDEVVGIDNLSTGKRANISGLSQLSFLEGDLNDMAAVEEACRGVDVIYHQAAIPSVPRSVKDPISTNESNVTGTLNLLVAAQKAGVRRVVYAGSSSAYGETPTLPKHEEMIPDPISPYAVSKLAGEYYMRSFYRVYGTETVVLRYFNVFGPRQDPTSPYSGVLAKFISKMLDNERPLIYGDGEQTRDFTYIDNVVQANLLAGTANAASVAGQVFNIAMGSRITLNAVFATLRDLVHYQGSAPENGAPREGDIRHSLADITKARTMLNYHPQVHVREGLRRTVNWYQQEHKSNLFMLHSLPEASIAAN